MSKTLTRVLCFMLVLVMTVGVFAACKKDNNDNTNTPSTGDENNTNNSGDNGNPNVTTPKSYTYRAATTALGTNWNPHTWETNAEDSVLSYLSSPFCTMSILDSEEGIYQWVFEMATSIEDVTKDHKDDLTKYGVSLPAGKTADETEEGYVFEIKLNPDAKWQWGMNITADDYIASMKLLLDSSMRNYRANLYYSGESAVAGGLAYYNSEAPIYDVVVPAYGSEDEPDYSFDLTSTKIYVNLKTGDSTISSYSFYDLVAHGGGTKDALDALQKTANAYGYVEITDANKDKILEAMDGYLKPFGMSIWTNEEKTEYDEELYMEFLWYNTGKVGDKVDYDQSVGCYKVDDYTIRYVCQTQIDYNYFLTSCTSTWLVYAPMYEANFDTTGELKTTSYMSSLGTSISYGPYKLESLQEAKQMVFVQNENWFGWERNEDGSLKKDENGNLISMTNFKVDGEYRRQYVTTKVVIDVMDPEQEKNAFFKGEVTEWAPSASELPKYATSEQLYQVDETYTMSFFFNCGLENLQAMDASKGNQNSVVLSNDNFRKAMSLAINRAEFVTATAGYKPAYAIMNNLYFYDVYNDPTSSYRGSDVAMQAICNLYGVKYGEGTPYATLKDAYNSITGYNLTEAKSLMKIACDQLVEAGLYTAGDPIKVIIGWAKGELTDDDQQQVALINKYVNAAFEGSGFGTITFEAKGEIPNHYSAVPNGDYAIGYGAWGGAAFYPFRNMQVYCDTDQYDVNETGCWDPATTELTINVEGEDVTMTWKEWSGALIGTGRFASASNETKLYITATMEEAYLKFYYRIPLCGTTACFLTSFQIKYYTDEYNIMYDFGGFRLMSYTMDDDAWTAYVASEGGTLSYE